MALRVDPGWVRAAFRGLALAAAIAGLGGCRTALFPEDDDRSQFAGYDRARDRTVPSYVEDEYGDRRPNLRGRLLNHD